MSRLTNINDVLGTVSPGVTSSEIKSDHGSARSSLEEELVRRDSICSGSSSTPSSASSIFEDNDGAFTPKLEVVVEEVEPLTPRRPKDAGTRSIPTSAQAATISNNVGAPAMWYTRHEADGSLVVLPVEAQSQDPFALVSTPGKLLPGNMITSMPPQLPTPGSTNASGQEYAGYQIWDKHPHDIGASIRYQELLSDAEHCPVPGNTLATKHVEKIAFKDRFMNTVISHLLGSGRINDQSLPEKREAGGKCLDDPSELALAGGHLPVFPVKKRQNQLLSLLKTTHPALAKEQFRTRQGVLWNTAISLLEPHYVRPTHLNESEFVEMVCGNDAASWVQKNISTVSRRSMEQWMRAQEVLKDARMHPEHLTDEFMCVFVWMTPQEQHAFVQDYKQLELQVLGPRLSQDRVEADLEAEAHMLDDALEKENPTYEASHTGYRRDSGDSGFSEQSEISTPNEVEYIYPVVSQSEWYGCEGPVDWEITAPEASRAAKAFGVRFTSNEPKALDPVTPGRQSLRKKLSTILHLGSISLKPRRSRANLKDAF